jgi:hypothetical protein
LPTGGGGPSGTGYGPDPGFGGGDDGGEGQTEEQQEKGQTFNAGTGVAPVADPQPTTTGDQKDNDGTPEVQNTQTDTDGQGGSEDSKTETHYVTQYTHKDGNTVVVTQTTTTKSNRPDPEGDSGGGESRPTIPYGPRHNNVGPLVYPNDPRSPANVRRRYLERMLLGRLGMYGYASGDDLGSAGYNPHFDPNPENTGASASEDSGPEFGPRPNPPVYTADQAAQLTGNAGPDPDNEWGAGGYNPHFQPSGGYSWSPYSKNNGSNALQQPTSRMRSAPSSIIRVR